MDKELPSLWQKIKLVYFEQLYIPNTCFLHQLEDSSRHDSINTGMDKIGVTPILQMLLFPCLHILHISMCPVYTL